MIIADLEQIEGRRYPARRVVYVQRLAGKEPYLTFYGGVSHTALPGS